MNPKATNNTRSPIRATPLVCSCGCTFAQVRSDGALVIASRHHGQKCVNVVTREDLEKTLSRMPSN